MRPNSAYQIASDLDNYLKANNYFEGEDEAKVNKQILTVWDKKFKSAIIDDLKSKYYNIEVDFILSDFELISSGDQGSPCVFFQEISISDKISLEIIKVIIKTLVNHNKINIYLDSSYATADKWQGKSKNLKLIFEKLKAGDKHLGYFNPIDLDDLIK